jgi:hypothetical protein
LFNDFTISEKMKTFGFKFTNELKGESTAGFRNIDEVEFLKRGFAYKNNLNRWVAPLRLSVILNIPMWTKKGSQGEKITVDNLSVCFRELSLHSINKFVWWSKKIKEAVNNTPLNLSLASDDIYNQSQANIMQRVCDSPGFDSSLYSIRTSHFYDYLDV